MKKFLPKDVDLSRNLSDTFGWVEFEELACEIIKYLREQKPKEYDESQWRIPFKMKDFPKIDHEIFAMFCAAGWVTSECDNYHDFTVGDGFIGRIVSKQSGRNRK